MQGYNTWSATASLYLPSNYRGQLTGQKTVAVDLSTGVATFSDLVLDNTGFGYILSVDVFAVNTQEYSFSVQLEPFDVTARDVVPPTGSSVTVTLRFDADYSIVEGKESAFVTNFRNKVGYRYTNVSLSDFQVSKGQCQTQHA